MDYRTFSIAVSVALALSSAGAFAAPQAPAEGYQSIVAIGDIDAANPDGAEALARKVRAAAKRACSQLLRGDALAFAKQRNCIRSSVAAAQPQVDHVVALAQRTRPAGIEVALAPRR